MFYLSKIVWAFFQPSSFITILLCIGLLLTFRNKRFGKSVLGLGIALYLFCGFSPLGNWLLIPLENRARIGASEPVEGAAGIIVLGGAVASVQDSGEPQVLLNESADRMVEALRVAQQHPEMPVIFSGGNGELIQSSRDMTEAEVARRFFEGFSIVPPRLQLESRSRNTLENAKLTAELMQPRSDQRWVLVTSAFHMPRARALFEAKGFRIIPRPGDFRIYSPGDRWRIFSSPSEGLVRVDLAAKEWVGLFVAWLRGDIAWPDWQDERAPASRLAEKKPATQGLAP